MEAATTALVEAAKLFRDGSDGEVNDAQSALAALAAAKEGAITTQLVQKLRLAGM
jgi:hypothetical protein